MIEVTLKNGMKAMIDDCDRALVGDYHWYPLRNGSGSTHYARGYRTEAGKRVEVLMHRLILDTPKRVCVDHIDGNGLNNTRANLRTCTYSENSCNSRSRVGSSSAFKGILHQGKKWIARIKKAGKMTYLGSFETEHEAARAYDVGAKLIHGPFARLNFPQE